MDEAGSAISSVDALRRCARDAAIASGRLLAAILDVAADAKPGFEADEVAFALAWTQTAARAQVEFADYLASALPDVFDALCRGDIDVRRAWVFFDVLCVVDDAIAISIAADVLPRAPELTTSQLRDRLRRAVLKADPDVRGRVARSIKRRYVACRPDGEATATLFGVRLPAGRATAAYERVDAFARGRKHAGDDRTLDQLRADTFLDLLEGVVVDAAPVHRSGVVELTVPWTTATGATDDPATLAGFGPIDADSARDLIARHHPGAGTKRPSAERVRWRHTLTTDRGELVRADRLAQAPAVAAASHDTSVTPSPALPDEAIGSSATDRVGPGPAWSPPSEIDPTCRYPGPALWRWIATRDRTCRAPGCRVPARVSDIDHTVDHAFGGETTHDNLALLCRHHHRLKH
ncbi:MAG TPA: DUF222 domain-containing protein, partial [Micromonosporaceae bacterium]